MKNKLKKSKSFGLQRLISSRKAQLQIMENIFVILIIFVILFIAFIFVVSNQSSKRNAKLQEQKTLELIQKAQILNFLPEMQCSDNNVIKPDCYDVLKIEAFKQTIEKEPLFYRTMFGYIKLDVVKYDPSPEVNKELEIWNVYDNPKETPSGYSEIHYPVLLKDVVTDREYFGVIYLGVYE